LDLIVFAAFIMKRSSFKWLNSKCIPPYGVSACGVAVIKNRERANGWRDEVGNFSGKNK
jgi:hypothetical protein